MKKIIFYSTLLLLIITVSCKEVKKDSSENKILKQNYSIDFKKTTLNWTAYKTTEKIPVKGVFQEVEIKNNKSASTVVGVLDGLEFEIPVSSIYSKDSIRDWKLKEYFFGVMKNTLKLTGKFHTEKNGKGKIRLSMNGLLKELPFTYVVQGDTIDVNATMNLDTWKAQAAIESLNVVCNEKHKGADGISKTWNEVAIHAQIKVSSKE
jgi:hypothetical protein